jgi:hypothetical protein
LEKPGISFLFVFAKLIGLCPGDGGLATTDILLLCFGGFGGNANTHNNSKTYAT